MSTKPFWLRLSAVLILLSMLGCNALKPPTVSPTATPTATTEAPQTPTPVPPTPTPLPSPSPTPVPVVTLEPGARTIPGYSRYHVLIPLDFMPQEYQGPDYTLPFNVASASNYGAMRSQINAAQRQTLGQYGFVVKPAQWRQFYQLYEANRYQKVPTFITVDAVYHVYHLYFGKLLRDLERERFIPTLTHLTRSLVQAAEARYRAAQTPEAREAARRVWAYFALAQQLLEETPPPVDPVIRPEVEGELALINAAGGFAVSALLPLPSDPDVSPYMEDYSQYIPRGHYTRSPELERYFRTMMWYGRINLRLQSPEETRMALMITDLLRTTQVDGQPAMKLWASIYDPTVFLVGKADDLGYYDYQPLMVAVYGPSPQVDDFADAARLEVFRASARALPAPQVNSMWVYIWEDKQEVTQGFRFMGQRFTLDAYVFGQMTWRNVGTLSQARDLPSGLDVFAAFGNAEAYAILKETGETQYLNYDKQLAKVRKEIAALKIDSWAQNVYWAWLYALQGVTVPKGETYPAFMRTQAWARKDLQSALGSYAELKHDTILYAKQTMAEMGGGPEDVPIRGYVEPNPEAFVRLQELTRMTRSGLYDQGLMTWEIDRRLEDLDRELGFLVYVAQWELMGKPLTEEDYARILYFGGWLEDMTLAAADPEEEYGGMFDREEKAAIITDVATGVNRVLEIGTGWIYELYVIVPDGQGGFQIARGGVYSYYEFPWPQDARLTDETWREMLEKGQQPAQPAWTSLFTVP